MVPQDGGITVTEGVGNALPLFGIADHAGVIVEHNLIAVEYAGVLGDGFQWTP